MKRCLTIGIVLLVCVAVVFAISACELKPMDGKEYYVSSEKDRSVELIRDFFEQTLENPEVKHPPEERKKQNALPSTSR